MTGLSPRNLKSMRAFAEAWPDEPIAQRLVAQNPWFPNGDILDKIKNPTVRERLKPMGWRINLHDDSDPYLEGSRPGVTRGGSIMSTITPTRPTSSADPAGGDRIRVD